MKSLDPGKVVHTLISEDRDKQISKFSQPGTEQVPRKEKLNFRCGCYTFNLGHTFC